MNVPFALNYLFYLRHSWGFVRNFMRTSGIEFGIFDFIVNKENEWYFLELNVNGQFLWMDNEEKGINSLGLFCKFLSKRLNFEKSDISDITIKNFRLSEEYKKITPITNENKEFLTLEN